LAPWGSVAFVPLEADFLQKSAFRFLKVNGRKGGRLFDRPGLVDQGALAFQGEAEQALGLGQVWVFRLSMPEITNQGVANETEERSYPGVEHHPFKCALDLSGPLLEAVIEYGGEEWLNFSLVLQYPQVKITAQTEPRQIP
jgi:hypothetical protein